VLCVISRSILDFPSCICWDQVMVDQQDSSRAPPLLEASSLFEEHSHIMLTLAFFFFLLSWRASYWIIFRDLLQLFFSNLLPRLSFDCPLPLFSLSHCTCFFVWGGGVTFGCFFVLPFFFDLPPLFAQKKNLKL